MKNFIKKLSSVLETGIGIALALCLFLGALGFLGFVAAFIIGGDTAGIICDWVYNVYYAFLIKLSTITTLFTFVLLYLKGSAKWVNPIKYWKSKN